MKVLLSILNRSSFIRRGGFAIFAIALGGLAFWIGSRAVQTKVLARTYSPRPFTYQMVSIAPNSDGVPVITEQRTMAIRQDGAEVWLGTFPNKPEASPMRKIIRPNGYASTAVERLGLKISRYLTSDQASSREKIATSAGPACRFPYEKDHGETQLLGARVSISHRQQSDTVRQTVWRALDYGCFVLAARHENFDNGQWKLRIEAVPIFFQGGEPAQELFDESFYDRLEEVSPSEAQRRVQQAMGITPEKCPACYNPKQIELMDREYFANQRTK